MSWDAYCENLVKAQPGVILNAALIGLDKSLWGATENSGFKVYSLSLFFAHVLPQVSQKEVDELTAAFKNPANFSANGIHIGGEKYLATKVDLPPAYQDGRSVYGRKGAQGVVMAKSNTAIVVAVYKDDAAHTVLAVEKLADYLVNAGY